MKRQKANSLENIAWSESGKQNMQGKKGIVTFSRQFARQKAAELEDFQGSTAPLGEGVLG